MKIGISYAKTLLLKIKPEKTLEQFLINHFGKELYLTFFKSYTEKVWGVGCDQISAEWGGTTDQRPVDQERRSFTLLKDALRLRAIRGYCAERNGNVADREVYVPQTRAGAALGIRGGGCKG